MSTDAAKTALLDALLSLQTRAEADAFLSDLCTPAELRAFSERWQGVQQGGLGGVGAHGAFHYAVTMEQSIGFLLASCDGQFVVSAPKKA